MTPDPVVGHELGEAIRSVVPPWLQPVFVLVTRLGNPGFFLVLFALDYWFGDHRRGAHAIAVSLAGIALVTGMKGYFTAPRPPDEITTIPITGYALPSGHATSSTIGYGILAYDLELGSRRWRYGLASVLVVLVALSRVVLGVHYVRDVLAGIVVGVLFLAGAFLLTDHDPRSGFALAVVLGAGALVVGGASHDAAAVFGAALGGTVTWARLDVPPRVGTVERKLALLALVVPALLALGYVGTNASLPLPVVILVDALVVAGVLVAPAFVDRVVGSDERDAVEAS